MPTWNRKAKILIANIKRTFLNNLKEALDLVLNLDDPIFIRI